jgi:outer membrane protein OmpA-like peptidoglycan-associated protein
MALKFRLNLIIVCLVLLLSAVLVEAENRSQAVDDFFARRKVLASVYFTVDSAQLNRTGEQVLDKLVPELEQLDPAVHLVRIEGIHPRSGHEKMVELAMLRAKIVLEYLHERMTVPVDLTLTGSSPSPAVRVPGNSQHRADIVVYDNLFDLHHADTKEVLPR